MTDTDTPSEDMSITESPHDPATEYPVPDAPEPAPDHFPGEVVFYDAAVFGQDEPVVHVGLVVHADADRVRVVTLGLASQSADFLAADVRSDG